jgi:hypothetical protein
MLNLDRICASADMRNGVDCSASTVVHEQVGAEVGAIGCTSV